MLLYGAGVCDLSIASVVWREADGAETFVRAGGAGPWADFCRKAGQVAEKGGTVYSIMGCAGSKRYGFNKGTYPYIHLDKIAVPQTETDAKNPTYNILSFTDDKISVVSKALDGSVIDTYTVTK